MGSLCIEGISDTTMARAAPHMSHKYQTQDLKFYEQCVHVHVHTCTGMLIKINLSLLT